MRNLLTLMLLAAAMLPALGQAQTWHNICDRTPIVRDEILRVLRANDCANVQGLASIERLSFGRHDLDDLPALRAGDFAGLTALRELNLGHLTRNIDDSINRYGRLRALPAGIFDGLTSLEELLLRGHPLTELPDGVFDGLDSLRELHLSYNRLTALPDGVFDGLDSLRELYLQDNRLTALPDGVFDGLISLERLSLRDNQLTGLQPRVFDDLTNLLGLWLYNNRLTTLPAGLFDYLTRLQILALQDNRLATLPAGLFDYLGRLQELNLERNHLVGLTRNDPLLRSFGSGVTIRLAGQTPAPDRPVEPEPNAQRPAAAVPLIVSASDSMRQGFVRIINESEESGSVRIIAIDDGGNAASPIEIQLGARQAFHFNSRDLEDGNANKGIVGVGSPMQGDWRLDIEASLDVQVLGFMRTTDGFLTAMHDVLPRDAEGRLVVKTFNPGSNMNQESKLRLVNTGANAESVSIEGIDDQGGRGGPVTLTLAAREARTLSAFDLENGAQGLTGTIGDGAGKWRLFITAGQPVVGVSLLEAVSGHLSNISTIGVAIEGQ